MVWLYIPLWILSSEADLISGKFNFYWAFPVASRSDSTPTQACMLHWLTFWFDILRFIFNKWNTGTFDVIVFSMRVDWATGGIHTVSS